MNHYIVEHKAIDPYSREHTVLWTCPAVVHARTAEVALAAFMHSKYGFKPTAETQFLHVRRAK